MSLGHSQIYSRSLTAASQMLYCVYTVFYISIIRLIPRMINCIVSSLFLIFTVKFQTFSGEVYYVHGRFALMSPWWEVTCSVQSRGSRHVMKGFPSYKLRSDLNRQDWIHIVSLILTACGTEDEYMTSFFQWLKKTNHRDVSLYNLLEVLDEFSEEGNESQVKMMTTRLLNSGVFILTK